MTENLEIQKENVENLKENDKKLYEGGDPKNKDKKCRELFWKTLAIPKKWPKFLEYNNNRTCININMKE